MKKKKVLITGGSGFIGSKITNYFVEKNYNVIVLDNHSRGKEKNIEKIKNKIKIIKGDIRDKKLLNKITKKIDILVHLAAINGTENFYSKPDQVLDVGINGLYSVLDAIKKNKVKEIYFASSSEIYNEPKKIPTPEKIEAIVPDVFNPRFSYAGSKIISEQILIHTKITTLKKIVIFRPHNIYGPGMGKEHVIPQLILKSKKLKKNEKLKIQGNGEETRSFMFIDDFVNAFDLIFRKGKNKNIYNIGNNDEIKIIKIAKLIIKYLNKENKIKKSKILIGSTRRRCPDISKLKRIGYKQKISLIDGVKKTINWYNSFY